MSAGVYGIGVLGGFGRSLGELAQAPATGGAPALDGLAGRVAPAALRRMDAFTRMGLLAALSCRDDAAARGVPVAELAGTRAGLVLATGYGPMRTTFDYLDSVLDDGEPGASPTAFSLSVQNMPAAVLCLNLGLAGPCATLCQAGDPVPPALLTAQAWLAEGRTDAVFLVAADESTPMLAYGLDRLRAEARDLSSRPGQGDGAVVLLLQRGDGAGRPYARLENGAGETAAFLERGAGEPCPGLGLAPSAWAADLALACWVLDGGEFSGLPGRPHRVECRCPGGAARLVRPLQEGHGRAGQ